MPAERSTELPLLADARAKLYEYKLRFGNPLLGRDDLERSLKKGRLAGTLGFDREFLFAIGTDVDEGAPELPRLICEHLIPCQIYTFADSQSGLQ